MRKKVETCVSGPRGKCGRPIAFGVYMSGGAIPIVVEPVCTVHVGWSVRTALRAKTKWTGRRQRRLVVVRPEGTR